MEFKLHLKLFSFLFVVIATAFLLYSEYFKMFYLSRDYAIWKAKYHLVSNYKSDTGVILLGDSRALAGVTPEIIGSDFYNFALGGSSTIETYYLLKKYLPADAKIKKVFISFYPERLIFDKSFGKVAANLNFELLSVQDIRNIFADAKRLGDNGFYDYFNNFQGNEIIDRLWITKDTLWRRTLSLRSSLFFFRKSENTDFFQDIVNSRGYHWIGIKKCSEGIDPDFIRPKFEPSPLFVYYFEKILKRFEEMKTPVKLIAMPINPATSKALSQDYRNQYKQFIESLAKNHPGLEYEPEHFPTRDQCDFGDDIHLNEEGARRWTTDLKEKRII